MMNTMVEFELNSELRAGRPFLSYGMAIFLLITCGCGGGGSELPTGAVSGVVTYQGVPVTEGFLNLVSRESRRAYAAPLGADGKYDVTEPVITGPYSVYITPPNGAAPTLENPSPAIPDPDNIPKKYRSEQTTEFSLEVKKGSNDGTFDMQP